jgi:chromosomal replication initiator protein
MARVCLGGKSLPKIVTRGRDNVDKPQLAMIWARIRGLLQADVGETEYRNWLRPMTLTAMDGDEVTISLPTAFVRD